MVDDGRGVIQLFWKPRDRRSIHYSDPVFICFTLRLMSRHLRSSFETEQFFVLKVFQFSRECFHCGSTQTSRFNIEDKNEEVLYLLEHDVVI